MGEVVEAWDVVLCRTVALKILRNMEPTAVIRFMHEAQIQARMVHPHVCRIYDVESSEGTVKIAMQLVRGPTLEQVAKDLSLEAVVTLMTEVAEAIHRAHNLKLIHRDLKPSNILLERGEAAAATGQEGPWTPYVCDFGLAMALDEPSLTFTHGVIGTPAFMAPEQYRGERNLIGPATDVYGLGGTLHFALLGRPPGTAIPDGAARGSPAQAFHLGVPADLWAIIRKCLEGDPALRYPTASALAEDLWRFLHGEPVQADAPRPWLRWLRHHRRHFRAAGAAALGILGLAGLAALEAAYLDRRNEASFAQVRHYAQEWENLERDAFLERLLPAHDLRPSHQKIRARLGLIRSRMESGGPLAQGPGHWALARGHLLLGEYEEAANQAKRALDLGFHEAEAAYLLAKALGLAQVERATLDATATSRQAEALFNRSEGLEHTPDDFARALTAFLQGDYGSALVSARTALTTRRLDSERVCLAADCLEARALQSLDTGDFAAAEAHYRESLALTREYLALCPSDERACHRALLAERGLASLRLDRGLLEPGELDPLLRRSDLLLALNPEDPGLQEDWLDLRFLRALADRERAPGAGRPPNLDQTLDNAMVFLGTRLKEPLPPPLRMARMEVYWQSAERHRDKHQDFGPDLAEALRNLDPAPLRRHDYGARLLAFKARIDLEAGLDPTPALDALLARLKRSGTDHVPLVAYPDAAEAWRLRARWEQAAGRDPAPSLAQAKAFSEMAAQASPHSTRVQALSAAIRALGARPLQPAAPGKPPV
jgi:hypothetical protein